MPRDHLTIEVDVCVVGAGIVGLAHAHEAVSRGLTVAVLDRASRALGASVRNFGHVFISAMGDGIALECALTARERWLEFASCTGLPVLEAGSLVIARHEDELAVMERLARDGRRGARLVTARQATALVPIAPEGIIGALYAQLDLRVDPRRAAAALAAALPVEPIWNAHVHQIEPGIVHSTRAEVRAPAIFVCPGPDFDTLPPDLQPRRQGLTRCKLQMLRVAPPSPGASVVPALLTGLSLLRYPGFLAQPGIAEVRRRLESERPELLAAGVHLIVTQLPDGDLILGDTHDYGPAPSPFTDERLDDLVLAEACRLFGTARLCVGERWQGVYPYAPGPEPFSVSAPHEGVRVVEVVSGIGMTTALGLAPRVLDDALGPATTSPPGSELSGPASCQDGLSAPALPLPSAGAHSGYGS